MNKFRRRHDQRRRREREGRIRHAVEAPRDDGVHAEGPVEGHGGAAGGVGQDEDRDAQGQQEGGQRQGRRHLAGARQPQAAEVEDPHRRRPFVVSAASGALIPPAASAVVPAVSDTLAIFTA